MNQKEEILNLRVNIIVYIFAILTGLIIYQLVNKQIIYFSYFVTKASNQYTLEKYLPAERGKIYSTNKDGSHSLLATNIRKYQVSVVPRNIKDKETVSEILSKILNIEKSEILNQINNDKLYIPPIAKKLDKSIAESIIKENLKGVLIVPESYRYYIENGLASQILGFVNADNKGQYGLEGYYNNELTGLEGLIEGEKDTRGRLINSQNQVDPKDGDDLILTIDRNVQYYIEKTIKDAVEKFKAVSGSVIVMDAKTGGIIAMANSPTYNNNEFNLVNSEDNNIYQNSSISSIWEPGSIFKPLVMGIALQEKLVEPETTEVFGNKVVVQNYEIFTATKKAFGKETMTEVLENSDNVAMVWIGDKIGNDKFIEYMNKMGIGTRSGIDIDAEGEGKVLDKKDWRDVTRATASFGQGFALTPIRMVQLYGAIANNGKIILPHVVRGILNQKDEEEKIDTKELGALFDKSTTQKLTDMLISVVENGHGKRAGVPGYKVAGKTGTAQIPKPKGRGYLDDSHIGSFAGFFPANDPKFVVLVKLDRPSNVEFAESSAAPTFGEIAKWLLTYYGIEPTN